jgi:hypothetical protein
MIVVLHVSLEQTNHISKSNKPPRWLKIFATFFLQFLFLSISSFRFQIVVLCWFTLRSYAANVLPASYAWSTFTGPVSGEVQEVKPWKPSSDYESENGESSPYGADYVVT